MIKEVEYTIILKSTLLVPVELTIDLSDREFQKGNGLSFKLDPMYYNNLEKLT